MTPVIETLSAQALSAKIKDKARELGFDLVGFAPAQRSRHAEYVRQWLADGRAGTMAYLEKRLDERIDPAAYLSGAQSVICVAMNYHFPLEPVRDEDRAYHGRIARYALGDDYHEIIKDRLHALVDWLRQIAPDARTRAAVDTAPVLERELAGLSGIGWVGKNTCIINPRVGSWLLLGQIITTLALPPDEPMPDHCGTCTRCIDACPTDAITQPYQLDASRCISYLTIEHRGEIPAEFNAPIGDWLYGCDICQDVCPHNSRAPTGTEPRLKPRFPSGSLDVREVLQWDEQTYRARLRHSAMKRIKLPVLKRNARIVLDNASP
ncbi:MAG TPA: tRNA epoxyqueuosine(34) reductase QueG [Humisphaera sp.]|jgi:epoxyqueuosine reductase|nr:tRNA epoxyqueuosine(34) reductase QueG [Humisphaera sp.]